MKWVVKEIPKLKHNNVNFYKFSIFKDVAWALAIQKGSRQ